ncbi:MAG TPA: hypothetical protein VNJ51_10775 [Candidatus Dormibacteraeota bacterium]|nr:hypothetical protein [Candidatus Dormibacteraeota bacterium]
MNGFAGTTIVIRVEPGAVAGPTTFFSDLSFMMERSVRPVVIAGEPGGAKRLAGRLNQLGSAGVSLSGADAGLILVGADAQIRSVNPALLHTLFANGYLPLIDPEGLSLSAEGIPLAADDVARAVGAALEAKRVLFFHASGGVADPKTSEVISDLTPAEALTLADSGSLEPELASVARAAARSVRAGVEAAEILDGRVTHAAIVEILTETHLGTRVTGSIRIARA